MFAGGIERDQWNEMGEYFSKDVQKFPPITTSRILGIPVDKVLRSSFYHLYNSSLFRYITN